MEWLSFIFVPNKEARPLERGVLDRLGDVARGRVHLHCIQSMVHYWPRGERVVYLDLLPIFIDIQAQEVFDLIFCLSHFLAHVSVAHHQELKLIGRYGLLFSQFIFEKMRRKDCSGHFLVKILRVRIVEAGAGLVIGVFQELFDLARVGHARLLIQDVLDVLLHLILLLISSLLSNLMNISRSLILLNR